MTEFNLQWSKALLGELNTHVYAQYFAIVSGEKILYIGKAFRANLGATLALTLDELKLGPHQAPEIYLGRLREYSSRLISTDVLESLHQLLVFAKRPPLNPDGKMCYNGLPNLKVANSGFGLMPGKIRAENRLVFLSKVPQQVRNPFQPAIAG